MGKKSLTEAYCPAMKLKIGEKQKHCLLVVGYTVVLTIGSISNDDDDGRENITKKMNLLPFKLYRVYLESLNSSDVGEFSWS